MKAVRVELQSCYGIKKLEHTFEFKDDNRYRGAIAVYAPNGTMKSSLARTFADIPEPSHDRIFKTRVSSRTIEDESGKELTKDNILVIVPFSDSYEAEQKVALLVNPEMQRQYDALIRSTEKAEEPLLENLEKLSGWKKDIRKEVSLAFTATDDDFLNALAAVKDTVENMPDAPLSSIKYAMIFEDSVQDLLKEAGFRATLKDYIQRYDELLSKSTYFKKGVFNYYHGETIAKALGDNGFFKAKHTVNLRAKNSLEVKTKDELLKLIQDEKSRVSEDDALRQKLEGINKKLDKNAQLRAFREYLHQNLGLLPLLMDLDKLKKDVWCSYFRESVELFREVVCRYETSKVKIQEIKAMAAHQQSRWEEVVNIFNDRFHVPFTLRVKNKADVVVGAKIEECRLLYSK